MMDDAAARIERMAQQSRHAVDLARLLSFAALIEPALMRAIRLELLPRADVSAEVDLWFGPLVQTRNRDGIVLLPRVAERLRTSPENKLAERSWRITEHLHDYLPPAIKLEEKLNWLSINPSDNAQEISELLQSALSALIVQARGDIANWAGRALPRLPQAVRGTESATMLAAASDLRLGRTQTLTEHLRGSKIPYWFSDMVPAALASAQIGVEVTALGLTFDPTPSPEAPSIAVPATDPRVVQITARGESMIVFIDAKARQSVPLSLDGGPIELTTIAGEAFTLTKVLGSEPKNLRTIMLSGTFIGLEKHREQAIKAIQQFGYKVGVMEEDWARSDADVIDSSLQLVRDSVAYALIIGRKYGQIPLDSRRNPNGLSVAELELDEAMRLKRPILLFIMGEQHLLRKEDVELDPGKRQKLDAFRERAKHMREGEAVQRVYETFESLEQFSTAVAIAVGRLVQRLDSSGSDVNEALARTHSNIPINVPQLFLGRDQDLAAIDSALKSNNGRAAITAVHGLRGVGTTTLAAAYAERHRGDYRATWWIRAVTESTLRADLIGLGLRLDWITVDEPEEPALAAVLERLRYDGDGVLLIYDNANNSSEIEKYLPQGGPARIIITSNAPNWSSVAAPVEIEVWPGEIGADYLIARTGRKSERGAALALSEALGGLPLAHEQAATYCDRTGISLVDYLRRFESAPAKLLDDPRGASGKFHYDLTVAKTFALAIDEAAKIHPAAEPLIVYSALLAPEPIPLFLFSEAREKFGETLASALAGDGLDEAVAALRAFALLDREAIADEREPTMITDCIRLHRLVREIAAVRREGDSRANARRVLIAALAEVYPADASDPNAWPRARRLDALAMALVAGDEPLPGGAEAAATHLLNQLGTYRGGALAAYAQARALVEHALAIGEKVFGPDHLNTAKSLNNLGGLLQAQGNLAGARPYYERALVIREKALGTDHPDTARSLDDLGGLLQAQGDLAGARPYYERAIAIRERALGADHPDTARSLDHLGHLLRARGDFAGARPYYERALSIREKAFGSDQPSTATSLDNLGALLQSQGDLAGARQYYERALAVREKALGVDHPETAWNLNNLGDLIRAQSDLAGARPYFKRALVIFEKALGAAHPSTKDVAGNLVAVLEELKYREEATALREKFGIQDQKKP